MHRLQIRNAALGRIIPTFREHGAVLDVGTGSGDLAHMLAEMGYDVQAVDIRPERCRFPEISVQQCDVTEGLPFPDETFDLVTATELIEHLEDPFKAVREFNRVLKPDGLLVLTTPSYGHIEPRIGYLFTGALPSPVSSEIRAPQPGRAHPHVAPQTVMRLRYLLNCNGFDVVHLSTCIRKLGGLLLAPVAALIWLVAYVLWSPSRRRAYHMRDQMKTVLGGRSLVTVSRKVLGAGDAENK